MYKILDLKTGLYSRGGTWPSWNKTGKIWKRKCDLTNHLNIVNEEANRRGSHHHERYKNSMIIEYEIVQVAKHYVDLWNEAARVRRQETIRVKEENRRDRDAVREKNERRRQWETLKKEFEND